MSDKIMTQTMDFLNFDQQIQLIEQEEKEYELVLKEIRKKYKNRKDLNLFQRLVARIKEWIGQYYIIITI